MGSSSTDIAKGTQVMGLFAQILSALGFVLIIIGACLLIIDLYQEFSAIGAGPGSEEEDGFEMASAIASGALMLNGMMLAAMGQALTALRSIAMNCATIANKS
ncbi:MAG: hypothetical protein P8L37_04820 [Phycisphaerales bacterium]|nr:hypothetical protein [Phycisphaerales bacterium]